MVHKLKVRGMPVHSLRAAIEWRAANLNPAQRKDSPHSPPVNAPVQEARRPGRLRVAHDESFDQARTRKEVALADRAEMESAEMEGELVRRAVRDRAEEKRASAVRETALQWPAQLAAVIAAESDIGKCHDILMEAVMGLLSKISGKAADGSA